LEFFTSRIPDVLVAGRKLGQMACEAEGIEEFALELVKILGGAFFLRSPGAVVAGKFDIEESTFFTGKEGLHRRYNQAGMLIEAAASGSDASLSFDTLRIGVSREWRWRGLCRLCGWLGREIVDVACENAEFGFGWKSRRGAGGWWNGRCRRGICGRLWRLATQKDDA